MAGWKWLIGLGIGAGIFLGLLVPVKYYRILNTGTDVYEAHYVLYGDRTKSQEIRTDHELAGVGAVVVNFRQSPNLPPVEVTVSSKDGAVLSRGEILPEQVKDDSFAWTEFSNNNIDSEDTELVVEFKAPLANIKNAAGLRFDKATGEVAIGLVERVTVMQRIIIWTKDYPARATKVALVGAGGSLVAVILGLAAWPRKILRLSTTTWLVMILAVISLALRIPTAGQVESIYGGDAFNYLIQSRAWLEGGNPFAEEFRRKAPLLPLLLLPAWLGVIDPIVWGRVISITAAVAAVVLLPLLLMALKAPRPLAIGAGLLLAVNKSFWWESVHGLANTLYAVLVLAAVYTFVWQQRKHGRYMVGVLSGLATLTRWEGAVVGAVLLPAVWIWHRLRIKTIIYTALPAAILAGVPFVFWPITGETGMRTWADITGDAGLKLAYGWGDFVANLEGFELFLGRNWVLVETVGAQLMWLLGGIGLGAVLGWLYKKRTRVSGIILRWLPWVAAIILLAVIVEGSREGYKYLALVLTALTGVGGGTALVIKPKFSMPVGLMMLGQVLVITVILPKSRYYMQLIPFLCAGIVAGLWALSDWRRSKLSKAGVVLVVGMLSILFYLDSAKTMPGTVSAYNEKTGDHAIVTKACKYLRNLTGKVAVVEESDLPARVYLTLKRTRIFPIEWAENMEDVSDEETFGWLKENDIDFLIETTAQPVFKIVQRYPNQFELVERFGSDNSSKEALVYRVKR